MERRRERFMIIYAWQMLEGKKNKNRCIRVKDESEQENWKQKTTTRRHKKVQKG